MYVSPLRLSVFLSHLQCPAPHPPPFPVLWDLPLSLPLSLPLPGERTQPVVVRLDRKGSLLWRVRNIPYPLSTYSVETDPAQDQVVIRTSNRKYFKRVSVPELARVRAAVKAAADAPGACLPSTTNATPGTALKISHGNNTLVIELPKPALLLAAEKTRLDEVKRLQPLAGPAGAGGAAAAAGAGGS